MKNKKASVVTASGFGDGLIMLVAANYLKNQGYEVTVFNNHLGSFQNWFPYEVEKFPENEKRFLDFDFCILQNDNSKRAKNLIALRNKLNLSVFYPSYSLKKHGLLGQSDFVFDMHVPMVENVAKSCSKLFNRDLSYDTGIQISPSLTHLKYFKRIVIHPLSSDVNRNYPIKKYIKLAEKLKKENFFEPVFIGNVFEKEQLKILNDFQLDSIFFESLSELAIFIYESGFFIGNESGPSHLASCLDIPLLIISNNRKRMDLWQPGWKKGKIICPFSFVPNFKNFRLKEKKWSWFIPVSRPFRAFKKSFFENYR